MRILVAMSGGVDSSVVAARLMEEGHEVIGATLHLYTAPQQIQKGTCCAGQDIRDARSVADKLGFPHYVIDAEQRFQESVITPFIDSYAAGETPVPCVTCNKGVKFTDLLDLAREIGAEAMATGHYVRRVERPKGVELHRPRDLARDQSWFLFATTRTQLDFLRFPLGDMPDKQSVRHEAERFGLAVADKPDSQDLCFVHNGSYSQLVERKYPEMVGSGDIVNQEGHVVGQHEGVLRFTVGQSKRLGNAASLKGERQMVVGINPQLRRITIAPRAQTSMNTLTLREVNWLIDPPDQEVECWVQMRARETPRRARVMPTSQETAFVFLADPAMPAPGQACVFYQDSRILGGGFICRPNTEKPI